MIRKCGNRPGRTRKTRSAILLYHLIVLMDNEGITLDEISEILKQRQGPKVVGNLKNIRDSDHSS